MMIDNLENELKMRATVAQWIAYREKVYDETNGRITSVHGKKVARYLEALAQKKRGPYKELLLTEAKRIEDIADKIRHEKERIYISPPI